MPRNACRIPRHRKAVDECRRTGTPAELREFAPKLGAHTVCVIHPDSIGIRIGIGRVGSCHRSPSLRSTVRRNALFVLARKSVAPLSTVSIWFSYLAVHGTSRTSRARGSALATSSSTIPATRSTATFCSTGATSICSCRNSSCANGCPILLVLGGRHICRDSQWGRVLASYVAQLSPEFVVQAPLPQAVLIDQLGALLALTAAELSGSRAVSTPPERSVRDQVYDHIKQRCPDVSLHAADVASSLNISKRTLHRALAACGETFGAMLIQARVDLRRTHASIAAFRSRDHGGNRATRRILGRLPLH